uniref:Late embryogenesis abundant protein LEA-2 subgroup domain-containing protein n=1 Tax=Oryza barthii TaxID=65489 RepID=A0A0D3GC66_9ORYZ
MGTLALTAVACTVSALLSPAHVFFSARASEGYGYDSGGGGGHERFINIIIFANNTSKHAEVHYHSMKTEVWLNDLLWLPVDFDRYAAAGFNSLPWQPPANTTQISARFKAEGTTYKRSSPSPVDDNKPPPAPPAAAAAPGAAGNEDANTRNGTGVVHGNATYRVVIRTQVRFRYGPARTRLYSILVTCPSVPIFDAADNNSTLNACKA